MRVSIEELEFQTVTDIKALKRGRYVVADQLDGNWMAEGVLEGIIWSNVNYPPKWVVECYPEIKGKCYDSMYGRVILRTSSGSIASFPFNLTHYTVKQSTICP